MGGGDLNLKKSWHPTTFRNKERVWIEEQKAKDEAKRTEQLQKELAEERTRMQLQRLQEQAGLIKPSNRLEWMYNGGAAVGKEISEEREAYLLGTKSAEELIKASDTGTKIGVERFSFKTDDEATMYISQLARMTALGNQNANSERDAKVKERQDPLFEIRRREEEAMRKMQQIQELSKLRAKRVRSRSPKRPSRDRPRKREEKTFDEQEIEKMKRNARELDEERRKFESRREDQSVSKPSVRHDSIANAIERRKHYSRKHDERW